MTGVAEPDTVEVGVIGGGILGLAVAHEVVSRRPGASVTVIEKETGWARHQTGRNSGVIHAGVYYAPGSLKAQLCREGNRSMVEFCAQEGIAHRVCGKLVVANTAAEVVGLERLHQRAVANRLEVARLGPAGARDHEPYVRAAAALWVSATGIVDYAEVAKALARRVAAMGGTAVLGRGVTGLRRRDGVTVVGLAGGEEVRARLVVNCAGLHADRVARMAGVDPGVRIVPFRGEYFSLVPSRAHLVCGLIYPVPDPAFPFLGVHLTRGIDGGVHAGPNAVPALAREGYRWRDVDAADLREVVGFRGFRVLARRHARTGAAEIWRSLSRRAFLRSLRQLVPDLELADLEPAASGVRAQALRPDGSLVDDFLIVEGEGSVHVCNAPSPAATASLAIARYVVDRLPG